MTILSSLIHPHFIPNLFDFDCQCNKSQWCPKEHWTPMTFIAWIPQKKVSHNGFRTAWEWMNEDRIVIFVGTIPTSVQQPKLLYPNWSYFFITGSTMYYMHSWLARPQEPPAYLHENIPFWSVYSKGANGLCCDCATSHYFKAVICVMDGSGEHMGGYPFVPQ